ncbi:MAG TPA: ABC transporter permease DevC [Gemmataceae bacterium]|nr:ABC transporter permease DevC [Gemmataceae bacterium]
MATSLAVRNLMHSKARTLVAMGGVCFAVVLLFMQLGFFGTVSLTAMLIYDTLDYDLLLTSPNYVMIGGAGQFSQRRLFQAESHPDVEAVMPLYVGRQVWCNPHSGVRRSVVVLGIRPSDPISHVPELERERPGLARPDTVLVDRLSRPEVGVPAVGERNASGPIHLQTIGHFTIGPGFEAGLIVVGDQTFSRLFGGQPLSAVNLGLVKLRSGADPQQVADQLRQSLPSDVRVLTRPEVAARERHYWLTSTSTGIIFGCGVIVAALFGIVITYQVLSLEVTHRLSEYATLKAVGFSDISLSLVVLQQALIFAVVSYLPGFVFALAIYHVTHSVTKLPIGMTVERSVGVFLLNLLTCCGSGLLALRILRRADPVDLF